MLFHRLRHAAFLFPFLFAAGQMSAYETLSDGVLFRLTPSQKTDPRLLKIQVCGEEIIRVIASPDTAFSPRPSLMTVTPLPPPGKWSVRQVGRRTLISTPRVTVSVDTVTGCLSFRDANGRPFLEEKEGGGKILSPAVVQGEQTFHVRQVFDSPADEAFYGLGGHQNGLMNYKGHDVDLWQKNMVEVVPFLLSSRNYGILWDNNSRTKFGDVREYVSLPGPFRLFGKDGGEGHVTAEYFRDPRFDTLFASRPEVGIEHAFTDVHDEFPDGFARNVAAVRWSGEIECREPGVHKFRLYCCGYTRMWLDGKLVVDNWRQNWLPWTHFPELKMESGKKYSIRIDWVHTGGFIGLTCLGPDSIDETQVLSLSSEVGDQLDYYVIKGENPDSVVHGYRTITGKAPMMPSWALGLWQSREHYDSQDSILAIVRTFRKRAIPLDNIVQDWFYWKEDRWGDHEFDSTRYPDPAGMIRTLHQDLHTHFMISVWGKFYTGTKNYEELKKNGWLYMRNVEKAQRDWVGPGYVSTFYDPYSAGARELYWRLIRDKLFRLGVDAWWLDSSEPDIQSNLSREETILRQGPTALGSASRYLNTYSLMNARGVYEGQRSSAPNQRVFILTRSAFAGQQRYAATTWSGDVAARWSDLRNQISSGMNFCLSGIPYWTTDIGGFAVEARYEHPRPADLEEWRELMTRWFQFGAFCPIFRVHGQFPYREMFHVAPETHPAYRSMLAYDRLRYRLMPYIYTLAGLVTHEDYTIMRALVMDFGADTRVRGIDNEFMFGPSLLVCPVSEYKARTRSVYLPRGAWYDLHTGKRLNGGATITAQAPYTEIPVFVREGSIVPCGPTLQYTGEKPADPIRLFVYTGRDASFSLYEDQDTTYDYEQGKFSIIPLRYDEKGHLLTIGARRGTFPGMLGSRTFDIVWIGKGRPSGMDFERKPDASVLYTGSSISVPLPKRVN